MSVSMLCLPPTSMFLLIILLSVAHIIVMYRSNRSFNMPPPGKPRAFDTFAVPGRREFDYQSFPGGGEYELNPRFHVKSLAWRAMGDPVLENFRGKDCTFVAYLKYLNFKIFNIGLRL